MEFPLYQCLDPDGKILVEPEEMPTDEELVAMYKAMWTARIVDERMITLQRQGAISFALSSFGEEACSAASASALDMGDWLYPQYREVAALFYRGYGVIEYIHHMFCNAKDIILGRQMPNHFGDRKLNVVTVSSPIGTKISHVAGAAYGMKIGGDKTVALCYFGEGASSEGDFHAGVNFAAVYRAPAIFFCRNNQYAISTGCDRQFASDGVAPKGVGYGIEAIRVDGNDCLAIYDVVKKARRKCLKGEGPILIEAMTYRMGAHSTSDDPSQYRKEGEFEEWEKKCPIKRMRGFLMGRGLWNEEMEKNLVERIQGEVTEGIKQAKRTPKPPLNSLIEDVYEKVPLSLHQQLDEVKEALDE